MYFLQAPQYNDASLSGWLEQACLLLLALIIFWNGWSFFKTLCQTSDVPNVFADLSFWGGSGKSPGLKSEREKKENYNIYKNIKYIKSNGKQK